MRLYDNSRTVTDETAILEDFQQRSQQAYADYAAQTVYYGDGERYCYDVFRSGKQNAPLLVFIHGGYWQWCAKEDFAFIVPPLLNAGWDVVLIEYPLTPTVTFAHVCDSVGHALEHLAAQDTCQSQRVVLSGHSAGGHLSALHQAHPFIDEILAISGLYDLQPLQATHLNEALQLNQHDIDSLSPIKRPVSNKPMHIVYGGQELDELQWQSTHYANFAQAQSAHVHQQALATDNHYSILDGVFGAQGYFLQHMVNQ